MDDACPVLAWCEMCRGARRLRERPLPEASPRWRPGLAGATLECAACETALLTIYQRTADDEG